MRKLRRPGFSVETVFSECIRNVQNAKTKDDLQSVASHVSNASAAFESVAASASYSSLPEESNVAGVLSTKEMNKVYDDRMVPKGSLGRIYYDKIIALAVRGICPQCLLRKVSTLDHYLPKARFPSLSVTPLNLVPSCIECNKTKLAKVVQKASEYTFHPYFDDFGTGRWLCAKVLEEIPPALEFYVSPPPSWPEVWKSRTEHHFLFFGLDLLYSTYAGEEMATKRYRLCELFGHAGSEGVREHLLEEAESCAAANVNSWKAATYQALGDNAWFCSKGFELIPLDPPSAG